ASVFKTATTFFPAASYSSIFLALTTSGMEPPLCAPNALIMATNANSVRATNCHRRAWDSSACTRCSRSIAILQLYRTPTISSRLTREETRRQEKPSFAWPVCLYVHFYDRCRVSGILLVGVAGKSFRLLRYDLLLQDHEPAVPAGRIMLALCDH